MAIQAEVLGFHQLFRSPCALEKPKLRVLALAAAIDMGGNTPIEFLLEESGIELKTLYVMPGADLPLSLPDHDVAIVVASDSEECRDALAIIDQAQARWPRPVLNSPRLVGNLDRDKLHRLLNGIEGLDIPATICAPRAQLSEVARSDLLLADIAAELEFPVVVRPRGSHAGVGLAKIDDSHAMASYIEERPEQVPTRLIGLAEADVVRVGKVERGDGGLLERGGSAHRDEVVGAADPDGDLGRADGVADPPPRHRVRLRHARDGDGTLPHAGEGGDGNVPETVVDDVLVDLVGDRERVVSLTQLGDGLELREREHLAGAHLGDAAQDLGGAEEVQAPDLVVGPPASPVAGRLAEQIVQGLLLGRSVSHAVLQGGLPCAARYARDGSPASARVRPATPSRGQPRQAAGSPGGGPVGTRLPPHARHRL